MQNDDPIVVGDSTGSSLKPSEKTKESTEHNATNSEKTLETDAVEHMDVDQSAGEGQETEEAGEKTQLESVLEAATSATTDEKILSQEKKDILKIAKADSETAENTSNRDGTAGDLVVLVDETKSEKNQLQVKKLDETICAESKNGIESKEPPEAIVGKGPSQLVVEKAQPSPINIDDNSGEPMEVVLEINVKQPEAGTSAGPSTLVVKESVVSHGSEKDKEKVGKSGDEAMDVETPDGEPESSNKRLGDLSLDNKPKKQCGKFVKCV